MTLEILSLSPLVMGWLSLLWLGREMAARNQLPDDWRITWLCAWIGLGAATTVLVEVTGSLGRLERNPLIIGWMAFSVAVVGLNFRLSKTRRTERLAHPAPVTEPGAITRRPLHSIPWDAICLHTATVVLTGFLLAVAILTPTTNFDSLAYHLPRVCHWIQQHNVLHFPTSNSREIEFGPWSGFLQTHLLLLAGSDRLANLIQWFSMVACVIGGPSVALQFWPGGAPEPRAAARLKAWTSLLIVTLPIGLVQSITTQTDYNTAGWLLCFVALGLAAWKSPRRTGSLVFASLALGLGLLTKATMLVYGIALVPLFTWLVWKSVPDTRNRVKALSCILLCPLLLNTGHFSRNMAWFHSPIGSAHIMSIERNANISISGTGANLIRNIVLETNTGLPPLTRLLNDLLGIAYLATGRDLNDPAITYHLCRFNFPYGFDVYDSYASNFYHFIVVTAAGLIGLACPRRYRMAGIYLSAMMLSFIVFCALLRWQVWHSRIHLGYFIAALPPAAMITFRCCPRWLINGFAAFLVFASAICLIVNGSRPVLSATYRSAPREQQYRFNDPELTASLQQLAEKVIASRYSKIGLWLGFNDPEYLVWLFLHNRGFSGTIDHYIPNPDRSENGPRFDAIVTMPETPLPDSLRQEFPNVRRFPSAFLLER